MNDGDPTPQDVEETVQSLLKFYEALDPKNLERLAQLSASLQTARERQFAKYRVAIINALPHEFAAVTQIFGDVKRMPLNDHETLEYVEIKRLSGINSHVVIAGIAGQGLVQAAAAVGTLVQRLPFVETIILVGIAAGHPAPDDAERDVCLGDIVVSDSVVQYDHLKREEGKPPECRGAKLGLPDAALVNCAKKLRSNIEYISEGAMAWPWEKHMERGAAKLKHTARPAAAKDTVASQRTYSMDGPNSRYPGRPFVHIGVIGSASTLLKDSTFRDAINAEHKTIAYEMEGAGVAIAAQALRRGYLVVRGICDYADMNKNDDWQRYASLAAASFALCVLEEQ